jgi:hypothetical protein
VSGAGPIPFEGASYTFEVSEAELEQRGQLGKLGRIRDVTVRQGIAYVAASKGLMAISLQDLQAPAVFSRLWAAVASTGVEPCGPYLCLSRMGLWGLEVVDVSDPQDMAVIGQAPVLGPSWDIATYEDKAYLAQGMLGLTIYDLSDYTAPTFSGRVFTWGRAVSLSASDRLLAVGLGHGTLRMYRLQRTGPELAGSIALGGKIAKVRMVGDLVYVLKKGGDSEAVDVSDPEAPQQMGTCQSTLPSPAKLDFAEAGAVSYDHRRLYAYEVVEKP